MSDEKKQELKGYADGWITERKGTKIPGFLKLSYPIIVAAMLYYIYTFMNGEVDNASRGTLVQQLNAVTGTANPFMYIVGAMVLIYGIVLLAFVYGKNDHED